MRFSKNRKAYIVTVQGISINIQERIFSSAEKSIVNHPNEPSRLFPISLDPKKIIPIYIRIYNKHLFPLNQKRRLT